MSEMCIYSVLVFAVYRTPNIDLGPSIDQNSIRLALRREESKLVVMEEVRWRG